MNNYPCFESNTFYASSSEDPYLATINDLPSAKDCQNRCRSEAACSYWSYGYSTFPRGWRCFLKQTKKGKMYGAGYTSGPDTCL